MADLYRCVKCGADNDNPRYHVSGYWGRNNVGPKCGINDLAPDNSEQGEHLHHYCKCGYDWITPLFSLDKLEDTTHAS